MFRTNNTCKYYGLSTLFIVAHQVLYNSNSISTAWPIAIFLALIKMILFSVAGSNAAHYLFLTEMYSSVCVIFIY